MSKLKKLYISNLIIVVGVVTLVGVMVATTSSWGSTNSPEDYNSDLKEGPQYLIDETETNIELPLNEVEVSGNEVEQVPIEQATKEQILDHQRTLEDVEANAVFWDEVEEDKPEEGVTPKKEIEGEEIIFREKQN